jgi:methylated-DNA-[protein]-cysteine S-methyltransferase
MEPTYCTAFDSPVGALTLTGRAGALTGVFFEGTFHLEGRAAWISDDARLAPARAQLLEYFCGERCDFELPLAPEGTPFQRAVWAALREIPYGETTTYGALARKLGKPGAMRAVGAANGRNPIAIVVPCHRVIGADGTLTGFGGGLPRKRWLLSHELARPPGSRRTIKTASALALR